MRIEFRTVYDSIENEKLGHIYTNHCIDEQMKQLKIIKWLICGISLVGIIFSIIIDVVKGIFIPTTVFVVLGFLGVGYCSYTKKKLYPKAFSRINGIGCPYNVTFGLYDEYFYEKFENNMSIQESSIRYEFLKKVVETPEYFVLLTNRTQAFFLPKRDMGYENVLEFSAFCKYRLGHIYHIK